jgi:hypothetical protein
MSPARRDVRSYPDPVVERKRDQPCEKARPALRALEDHAYQLYLLTAEDDFAFAAGGNVDNWLILASGLSEVSIITSGLSPQDAYCANIFEEAREVAATAVATELTRVLFIWGALESLSREVLPPRQRRDEGPAKRVSRLVDARAPKLLHHDCTARNLFQALDGHGSDEFAKAAADARALDTGVVGQATLAAHEVRNLLAHGAVPWPDDDDALASRGVIVGRLACRMLLFATQHLIQLAAPPTAITVDMPDDEPDIRRRLISAVVADAHLHPQDVSHSLAKGGTVGPPD